MSSTRAPAAPEYPRDAHAHVEETEIVAGLLGSRRGEDHVMLDVGANKGSSAIHFDRLGWTVHCFEPHPGSREALTRRFANRPNIHVDGRALGDATAASVPLYESPESTGISGLNAFHPSHRPAGTVEVTTLAVVARELNLTSVDFLKIDVEGHDFAVLRGVPWDELAPDVIECEFEDAKTLALGHSWRDIAAYLREHGYAVYVSEWHPIIRYGIRHDWRRLVPLGTEPDVHPDAWGNLLAFRTDPGLAAIRGAFDTALELGPKPKSGGRRGGRRRLLRIVRRIFARVRGAAGSSRA